MKQAARAREEDQIRAISELTTVRRENWIQNHLNRFPLTNTNTHAESKTIR